MIEPLIFDPNRYRVKFCPCGKSNKDGKFHPYKGHDKYGYCFSCCTTYLPNGQKREAGRGSSRSKVESDLARGCHAQVHEAWQGGTEPLKDKSAASLASPPFESLRVTCPLAISNIPYQLFFDSLRKRESNFMTFLEHLIGKEQALYQAQNYCIGSSDRWPGAVVFWQVDANCNIRTGKIMQYNPQTGKRVKEPTNHIAWVHTDLKDENFRLQQCFFGEYLLHIFPDKPIALVESEKTAVIASAFLPQFSWLATGGIANLNTKRCEVLRGKNVSLFPDLNAYDKWKEKAAELSHIANFQISDLLENNATDEQRRNGLDLGDYLIS